MPPPDDLWALWPDDIMCALVDLDEYLAPPCARSDDFQIVRVTDYDEAGAPNTWEPYVGPATRALIIEAQYPIYADCPPDVAKEHARLVMSINPKEKL